MSKVVQGSMTGARADHHRVRQQLPGRRKGVQGQQHCPAGHGKRAAWPGKHADQRVGQADFDAAVLLTLACEGRREVVVVPSVRM